MKGSKRKHDYDPDQPQKKSKNQNNDSNNSIVPPLSELPDDILDHILTNFLGVSSLLNIAMTCSKLNNLVSSQYKRIMRRIFPCRLDATDEVKAQIRSELKNIAKIEKAFDKRVRMIEIDDDHQRVLPPIFKSFPADPTKLLCVTTADSSSLVQIIDMDRGNVWSVRIDLPICDVAMSSDHKAAFLARKGEVQIHSLKNPAHWTKVCAFKTTLQNANIQWMSSTGYWIIYQDTGNYQVVNESGECINAVEHDDDVDWRLLAVSNDGTDAVQVTFRPYQRGKLNRVNLLSNELTRLLDDTDDSADDLCDMKFIAGSDWVTWRRMGTEKMALFMYNLKTGERYWTPTSSAPRLSYAGTMVLNTDHGQNVLKMHDLYSDQQFQLGPFEGYKIPGAEWTYLLDENGHLIERIVASLSAGYTWSIGVIDPSSRKSVGVFDTGDINWQLQRVLANGRTLVFRDRFDQHDLYFMVWNLY